MPLIKHIIYLHFLAYLLRLFKMVLFDLLTIEIEFLS